MKYTLNLIGLTRDHGDGSSSCYIYNDIDELLSDHPKSYKYFEKDCYTDDSTKLNEEDKKDLLYKINNDPYEYGGLDSFNIEIEIIDGKAKLLKPFSVYSGNQ